MYIYKSIWTVTLLVATSIAWSSKNSLAPQYIETPLAVGSGHFVLEGTGVRKNKEVIVHYYLPKNNSHSSKVIIVVPGGGRNGDDYRDAWIDSANKYNLIVLSPEYAKHHYPGWEQYNMGGLIASKFSLFGESYAIINDESAWIFSDFDKIFDEVIKRCNSKESHYDLFGHSAGGQILHRTVLFNRSKKSRKILAANSGWYTLPNPETKLPYGLKDFPIEYNMQQAFVQELVIFLGNQDNENEIRGHLRTTPLANKQGSHRLARGKFFFKQSYDYARIHQLTFNWKLHIVANVGHSYQEMGKAAADYLYGN